MILQWIIVSELLPGEWVVREGLGAPPSSKIWDYPDAKE